MTNKILMINSYGFKHLIIHFKSRKTNGKNNCYYCRSNFSGKKSITVWMSIEMEKIQ